MVNQDVVRDKKAKEPSNINEQNQNTVGSVVRFTPTVPAQEQPEFDLRDACCIQ